MKLAAPRKLCGITRFRPPWSLIPRSCSSINFKTKQICSQNYYLALALLSERTPMKSHSQCALVFAFLSAVPLLYAQAVSYQPLTVVAKGSFTGIAVDGSGNLFMADSLNHRVLKLPSGGGAPTTVATGFRAPVGPAVDTAGDLFIADLLKGVVVKVIANGSQEQIATRLDRPTGVAVDAAGNVFIAEGGNRVLKLPAGGGEPITVATGLRSPWGVAVNDAGDVFIADTNNSRVVKVPAGGGPQTTLGSGFKLPRGVAVDTN